MSIDPQRKRNLKLVAYVDKGGKHRWRCLAGNGWQLAKSPKGYADKSKMAADISEFLSGPRDPKLYKDKQGKWRWRYRHSQDGHITAITSEGYENRGDCEEAGNLLLDAKPVSGG
jgi:uncharacterized protein YegP (UPF0339 family)